MPDLNAHITSANSAHTVKCVLKSRTLMSNWSMSVQTLRLIKHWFLKVACGMVPCLHIEHEDGTVEWMYESDDIIVLPKELAN